FFIRLSRARIIAAISCRDHIGGNGILLTRSPPIPPSMTIGRKWKSPFLSHQIYFYHYQPQAGSTVFGRYMDISYNAEFQPQILYQYEWVNPYPEKTIKLIKFANPHKFDFDTRIFAVSGRLPLKE
ncbi:MAG: hypothetical protein GX927_07595, partial [Lentisphaerae bacterium]|nr:hypothetical protein [Lentisphaerota bacterium]